MCYCRNFSSPCQTCDCNCMHHQTLLKVSHGWVMKFEWVALHGPPVSVWPGHFQRNSSLAVYLSSSFSKADTLLLVHVMYLLTYSLTYLSPFHYLFCSFFIDRHLFFHRFFHNGLLIPNRQSDGPHRLCYCFFSNSWRDFRYSLLFSLISIFGCCAVDEAGYSSAKYSHIYHFMQTKLWHFSNSVIPLSARYTDVHNDTRKRPEVM